MVEAPPPLRGSPIPLFTVLLLSPFFSMTLLFDDDFFSRPNGSLILKLYDKGDTNGKFVVLDLVSSLELKLLNFAMPPLLVPSSFLPLE
jgi:hypothetical protein